MAVAAVIIAAAATWVWETGKAFLPNGGFASPSGIPSKGFRLWLPVTEI